MSRWQIVSLLLLIACLRSRASDQMQYTISRLWDNRTVADTEAIDLSLGSRVVDAVPYLQLNISAPFYDDPKLPDNTTVGSTDQLWNYEVVELFLLGDDRHYLEVELGPKGHYLLLQLHGYRNVTQTGLHLDHFSTRIDDKRWTGSALIPGHYLPHGLSRFNAYAIHGSGPHRQYLSLFPTPFGKYKEPDFHRLDYFGDFKLKLE